MKQRVMTVFRERYKIKRQVYNRKERKEMLLVPIQAEPTFPKPFCGQT